MEKNIRHVQRWLERCLVAYRQKRGGAALAELESARAELELAREVLADELAGRRNPGVFPLGRFSRVVLTSLVLFFSFALPTANRSDRAVIPFQAEAVFPSLSVEVVTEEERLLLQNLRRPPAVAQIPPSEPLPETLHAPQLTAQAKKSLTPVPSGKDAVAEVQVRPKSQVSEPGSGAPDSDKLDHGPSAPSVEEFLALLQAGQRALQSHETGIPIQP